jgi:hypothetical protein
LGKSIKLNINSVTTPPPPPSKKNRSIWTGFLGRKEMKGNNLSFKPRNERLCKLRIKGKFNNLSVISVHAPTEGKTDEEKETFYEDLQIVHKKLQNMA